MIAATALLAGTAFCVREIRTLPRGTATLHVFDIGQGSAALLITPSGRTVLFDGGADTLVLSRIAERISLFRRTIDLLVISHADADHIGGIPEVLRRYAIGRVLLNGEARTSPLYQATLKELRMQHIPVLLPDPGTDIVFGDGVILDVVWPRSPAYMEHADSNASSVAVRILCGNTAAFLTGDIDHDAELSILETGRDIRSNILTAPHHGSRTSSSTGFLLATDPSFIAISAGKDNRYGHPHTEITDRYRFFGIQNKVTAEAGTLSFVLCST